MPRAWLGPPVGSLTEHALHQVAVHLCACRRRGAVEIEGRHDAAPHGARAGGTHRHPRAQTPRRLGRRKRHVSAERAAATPLEGAVHTPARVSLSADRSRCSRGELVAPAAATPSKPRMAPPWARVPSCRPHPRQIPGKILRGAVCVQILPIYLSHCGNFCFSFNTTCGRAEPAVMLPARGSARDNLMHACILVTETYLHTDPPARVRVRG